jgi:hypothetical protein
VLYWVVPVLVLEQKLVSGLLLLLFGGGEGRFGVEAESVGGILLGPCQQMIADKDSDILLVLPPGLLLLLSFASCRAAFDREFVVVFAVGRAGCRLVGVLTRLMLLDLPMLVRKRWPGGL